jgi:hypothetical protein
MFDAVGDVTLGCLVEVKVALALGDVTFRILVVV